MLKMRVRPDIKEYVAKTGHDVVEMFDTGQPYCNEVMRNMGGQIIKVCENRRGRKYKYRCENYGWLEEWLEPLTNHLEQGEEL